jgi:hypothetical protein
MSSSNFSACSSWCSSLSHRFFRLIFDILSSSTWLCFFLAALLRYFLRHVSLSSPCIYNMLLHWLFLVFCSVTRKNYFLSVFVYPETIITSCYHLPPWIHTEICVTLSCSSCSHSNSWLVNVTFYFLVPHKCWWTRHHLPSWVHTGSFHIVFFILYC